VAARTINSGEKELEADMRPNPFYLPIAGTHGWRGKHSAAGRWWRKDSRFGEFMVAEGFVHLGGDRPFVWTTDVNGHRPWRRLVGVGDPHLDWECAGENLAAWLRPYRDVDDTYTPLTDRRLIVHSHGLQPVLYACANNDLKVHRLVSVMSPVRRDLRELAEKARPNIGKWLHLHTDASDRWQWLGAIGDGAIGINRRHPLADYNVRVKGAGHTGVLEDPALITLWREAGWLDFLSEPVIAVAA
jgi:hypothetical protein